MASRLTEDAMAWTPEIICHLHLGGNNEIAEENIMDQPYGALYIVKHVSVIGVDVNTTNSCNMDQ